MLSDFQLVGVSAPRSAKSDRSAPHSRLHTSRSLQSSNGARNAFLVRASRKHNAKPREEMPRDENDSLEIMFNSSSSINAENVSYYSSLSRNDSATGWHDEIADWNNIEVASVDSRGDHAGSGCRVTPVEKLEGLSDRSLSPRNSFESDGTLVSDREPEHKPSNRIVAECTPRGQQLFHPTHASGDKNLEAGETPQHSGTPGALSETSAVIRLQRWWRRHLCYQRTEAVMLEQLLAEEKRRIGGRVSSLASTPRSAKKPAGRRTPRPSLEVSRRSLNITYEMPCETANRPTTKDLPVQQGSDIYGQEYCNEKPAENNGRWSPANQCAPISTVPCNLGYGANGSEIQAGISKPESSPTQTAWKDEIEERRSTLMTNILSDLDSLGKLKREPWTVQAADTSFDALELNTGSDIRQPADTNHCGNWGGQENARGPEKPEEFPAPSPRRVSESVDFAVATKGGSVILQKSSFSFREKEPALYESGDLNLQNPTRSYDPTSKAAGSDAIQPDQTEISPKPRIRRTPAILTPRQLCISNLFSLATRWNAGDAQYDDIIHDLEEPECGRPLHLTESMKPDAETHKETDAQKHPRSTEGAEVTYEELAAALSMEKVKTAKLEEFVNNQYDSLQQQRELSIQQVHETETNYEQRLAAQKEEYEATINKNYKLIDELIAEKQALTQQCSKLVDDMRILKEKAEAKQKLLEDNHKCEIQKLQGKFLAAEKLRRERWEASKIKSIKELTIKGVEKEIARLVASHKEELEEIRKECISQVQAADSRAFQSYSRQLDELRLALTQEKEEACAKERKLANERFENIVEDERASLAKLRKRLLAENADERERMVATSARQREEFQVRTEQLESEMQKMAQTHREEMERLKTSLENKHASQLEELKTRSTAEREVWEQKFRANLEVEFATREREISEKLRKDRDKQLEMVIRNLEAEATAAQEAAENATNGKLKSLKERHQREINELEQNERQITEKYNQLRTRCLEHEGEIECLTVRLNQRENEIKEVQALYEKLKAERDQVADVVRQEFADRLVASEEEVKTLRMTLAETKSKLALEVEKRERDLQLAKESMATELERVHERVKDAVRQKEINIGALKKDHEKEIEELKFELQLVRQRSEHLEKLLDQQRKQLLQLKPRSVHRK